MQLNTLIASIPTFHGKDDENVDFFIRIVSDVCNLQAGPDACRIVLLKLLCRDRALQYVSGDPEIVNEDTFVRVVRLLRQKFSPCDTFQQGASEFSKIYQKSKQSVKSLAEEIRKIVNKMIPNVEEIPEIDAVKANMMSTKFSEVLRLDIKTEVLKFGRMTFDDLVATAMDIENALDQQTFSVNNIKSSEMPSTSSQDSLISLLIKQ